MHEQVAKKCTSNFVRGSMKVLITGGAGFLGLHLATKLADQGHEVSLLDVADFDSAEYPAGVRFHKGDVRDVKLLYSLMEGIDAVVLAAAALPLWKPEEIFSA